MTLLHSTHYPNPNPKPNPNRNPNPYPYPNRKTVGCVGYSGVTHYIPPTNGNVVTAYVRQS